MNYETDEPIGSVKPTISSYLWEINNFSDTYDENGIVGFLKSSDFSTDYSYYKHDWCLRLYPKSHGIKCKNHISIFLNYLGVDDVHVNVILSVLDDKQCKVKTQKFAIGHEPEKLAFPFLFSDDQELIIELNNDILASDKIRILCEIIYDSNLVVPFENSFDRYCRLEEFDDFEKLYETGNSADVSIQIGNKEIKVHKAIIMTRSPVFNAMFEHETIEKEKNVVKIPDIKYEVMKELFRFMYVGRVNGIESIAEDLIFAADKYSIKGLKALCEKEFLRNLAVTNVIERLAIADLCNATTLKAEIVKFIVCNQEDVSQEVKFKLLPRELMYEVLTAIIAKNSTNKLNHI